MTKSNPKEWFSYHKKKNQIVYLPGGKYWFDGAGRPTEDSTGGKYCLK